MGPALMAVRMTMALYLLSPQMGWAILCCIISPAMRPMGVGHTAGCFRQATASFMARRNLSDPAAVERCSACMRTEALTRCCTILLAASLEIPRTAPHLMLA